MEAINNTAPVLSQARLGIRGRLMMGFAAISLIILVSFSIILIKIQMIDNFTSHSIETDLPTHDTLYDLDINFLTANEIAKTWLLTHDPKLKHDFLLAWNNLNQLQLRMDDFVKNWKDQAFIQKWQAIKLLLGQAKAAQEKVFNASMAGNTAAILKNEIIPTANQFLDLIDGPLSEDGDRHGGLFDEQFQQLQKSTQAIISNITMIKRIESGMLLCVLLFSFFIAWITSSSILNPLNNAIDIAKKIAAGERKLKIEKISKDETGTLLRALEAMQESILKSENELKKSEAHTRDLFDRIVKTAHLFSQHSAKVAAGDLTQRLSNKTEDEMGRLGNDLNLMTENLSAMTKQITEACHNMVSTLEEVKHSVDIQSSGASEQASSINQITASLGEIEKSSTQTIEKAKALGAAADRTREKGQRGLEAVEQSINGMKDVKDRVQTIAQTILDLSNKTQQVGEITAVVNGLAQQSKMLALNASIEAAKAGEAGKGFAVVASEVKTLAEQSEQSTTQVQKILEDIRHATEKAVMATEEGTKGVDYGTNLVEQTGDIVRSLSEVISETTTASQQIEAAVRQESIGIEQITAGMNEINQVTSEFVESVKQTTEAINNLSLISHNLKEQVDIYKI